MSATLSFTHHLLARGRELGRLGQTHAASRLLDRLASCRDLPKEIAEETHAHLAELHLQQGHLKKARRRLTTALAHDPENAHYHFLLAGAIVEDETCDPDRALRHYRRCAKLDPDEPKYWCGLGLLALSVGQILEGLRALRRAHELAPDDPKILRQVAEGLGEHGHGAEAKKLLKAALFRNPRERRFRDLWSRHQFQLLCAEQRQQRSAGVRDEGLPIILPFCRAESNPSQAADGRQIRRDPPSGTPAPKLPLRRRHPSRQPGRDRGSKAE
jgi:tetratricopeptide (TPR) repeat protein